MKKFIVAILRFNEVAWRLKISERTQGALAVALAIFMLVSGVQAVFVLPSQITVAARIDSDGTLRTDIVQDDEDTAPAAPPPAITLTGDAYLSLSVGAAYTEYGATCLDDADGAITVPAPTFFPTLSMSTAGTYTATYTCTNSASVSRTATRIVGVGIAPPPTFGPQSSTFATVNGFDFAETFDGLADWNGSGLGRVGNQYDDNSVSLGRMPKLADGSTSALGFFSLWGSPVAQTSHNWIGTTQGGARRVWRGTKSAAIDLGSTAMGPSRLGLAMGDGYHDFSLFYMVWIPANNFPTSYIPGGSTLRGTGVYTEGQPYTYYNSWKFNTFNVECDGTRCPDVYGLHHTIPHIKQYNYPPNGLYIQNENDGDAVGRAHDAGDFTLNAFMGQWWGVEFRIRNNAERTAYTMDIWAYDRNGNGSHIMQGQTFPLVTEAHGGKWDQFFFGGNNSNTWDWGPTMQSHYYVDDLIIDSGHKGQIGPRYFNAIGVTP